MERYVIVCDESTRKGNKYSYFFGGALLKESSYAKISEVLSLYSNAKLPGEVKRTKITLNNCKNYIELLDLFFTYIQSGQIKARIMFSPNKSLERIPKTENETYSKFYYLFIRHAFSIFYIQQDISLRLIFDELPETLAARRKFKYYLEKNLNSIHKDNKVVIAAKDIEEVNSEKHPILQCVDVLTGLVDFALNCTPSDRQTKRGAAKWELWKFILKKIEEIHPDFSIIETTNPLYSKKGWLDPYKHFIYKKKKNKAPVIPT